MYRVLFRHRASGEAVAVWLAYPDRFNRLSEALESMATREAANPADEHAVAWLPTCGYDN